MNLQSDGGCVRLQVGRWRSRTRDVLRRAEGSLYADEMRTELRPNAKFTAKFGQNRRRSCKRGAKTTRWRLTEAHGSQHGNHVWCRHCAGNICKHSFLTQLKHRAAIWVATFVTTWSLELKQMMWEGLTHTCLSNFGHCQRVSSFYYYFS